jgi:hypothetical protein
MDSTNETTPIEEISTTVEQPEEASESKSIDLNQEIELDGAKVSIEELTKGYLRQSDYTRKTQELAEQRKALEQTKSESEPDEVKNAKEFLKSEGYVTKEDLERIKAEQADEMKLQRIFDQNPDLKAHEQAIRAIGKTDNSAYEDIIVKYNFSTKDKLAKARSANSVIR